MNKKVGWKKFIIHGELAPLDILAANLNALTLSKQKKWWIQLFGDQVTLVSSSNKKKTYYLYRKQLYLLN
ncbi:hypothetical protein [Endozoicomonas lisbonensis]|uniref:Uncharacterized protein n=1 Tax=Endozoicomonas lisbonensis TaxID=3120522 RepID=A0ABV2SCY1_9GAMM